MSDRSFIKVKTYGLTNAVLNDVITLYGPCMHVEMISGRCAPQWNVRCLHTVVYVVVARVAEAEPGIRAEQLLAALHQRHAVDSRACAGGWGGEGGSRSGRALSPSGP